MLNALLLHGFALVVALMFLARWLDVTTIADVCLVGLVTEIAAGAFGAAYSHSADLVTFAHVGMLHSSPTVDMALVLCFDGVGQIFFAVLSFALVVCFFFLVEYFEYDAGASSIVLLSALFSHAALGFFATYDLLSILFFWEAISIISFFLVQHGAFRLPTLKAGLKVFTISQLGDLPLLAFVILASRLHGSTDCGVILPNICVLEPAFFALLGGRVLLSVNSTLAVLLSFAMLLKAAQFVFYPWLLDAMEAPVPISAQLHSSTLVIIGFYLYFRFLPLFETSAAVGPGLTFCGGITVVGACALGFVQDDGKRLLACSTASQLGYVVVALGVGLVDEAAVLLAFCCCNKAVTFVWFGVLMDRLGGASDFRAIGGQSADLTWGERSGITVAIANFTIAPGAFSGHVKALFVGGGSTDAPAWYSAGCDVLGVTWFLTSAYLFALYSALFMAPRRGPRVSTHDLLAERLARTNAVAAHLTKRPWSVHARYYARIGTGHGFSVIMIIATNLLVGVAGCWFAPIFDGELSWASTSVRG